MRIALVDDNELVRQSYFDILTLQGHTITGYSTAEDFIASNGAFDFLVIDYRLPGMDGCELIRTMRTHGQLLPTILLSGNLDKTALATATEFQHVTTMPKPCSIGDFLEAINSTVLTPAF